MILIAHNIRSAHNVGALFRTADGAGVEKIFLTGYTPKPPKQGALFLTSAEKALQKTALGSEVTMPWQRVVSLTSLIATLRKTGYTIIALEQDKKSVPYDHFVCRAQSAMIVGNEVSGIDKRILSLCDVMVEIPMRGQKNSLNVAVATGIALYHFSNKQAKK
ncbi:MAG: TrmH family RNA methyltransferase [Minisyncoccota bacterium]